MNDIRNKNVEKSGRGDFEIRAYLKTELARRYFQGLATESAMKKMRHWIKHNPALYEELHNGPEGKRDQTYSRRQVEVLVRYLDVPSSFR